MAREKVPTPMLEEFLRQAHAPDGGVSPVWLDWPLAIVVFVLALMVPVEFIDIILAFAAAAAVLAYRRSSRRKQLALQTPVYQAAYERWDRARRLVSQFKSGQLHSHVPIPVLVALERAARSWHDAREELRSLALADATFVGEIQAEVDAIMMVATAAACPVIRRDDQGSKAMRKMEEDTHLMGMICRRI